MKKKERLIIVFILGILLLFSSGITYSIFTSGASIDINNQKIAKFVFNTEKLDHLELPLVDLNPGDSEQYLFSVSNIANENLSNVSVDYQIIIKTFHLIPLKIDLYKVVDANDEFIMSCDETYSRNADNELVCNSDLQEMPYTEEAKENYKLVVSFPSTYVDDIYSNLVDYIDIEIKSWQKVDR